MKKSLIYHLIGVFLLLVIIVFLLINGFRIVYDPQIVNDWGAISACAAWVGVFMSLGAIVAAIWIPTRIADQQNKIALFERRMEFYDILCKCENLSTTIGFAKSHEVIILLFIATFKGESPKENNLRSQEDEAYYLLRGKVVNNLRQGRFLFEEFDANKIIDDMIDRLELLTIISEEYELFEKYRSEYQDAVKVMKDQLMPQVEESLKLAKNRKSHKNTH